MKKALILDLDNTIYPVQSIADKLFSTLFEAIDKELSGEDLEKAKAEIKRKPFQHVAQKFNFSETLTGKCIHILKNLTYEGEIKPFEDYSFIKEIPARKFLVTTGFLKLQQSKINGMKISNDFEKIFIVDPENSSKKEVFIEILGQYQLQPEEVLVIGDDPESEIKAAKELEIETFLLNPNNSFPPDSATYTGRSLKDVLHCI